MTDKRSLILSVLIFVVAFSLRIYDCSNPPHPFIDEAGIVQGANNYWHNGQFEPVHWEHPPLKQILPYVFLQLLGDNPYGWRVPTILFGSAVAALTYIFALGATDSRKTAFLAGMLIATDPLHIVISRHAFEEIYSIAFFLAAVVLYQWHRQRSSWLILSALFVGCAMSTKWYYFPAWFLLYLHALYEYRNYRKPGITLFITCTYVIVPLTVYILVFYKWFGRGYSFNEFIEFVANVFSSMPQYTIDNYMTGLAFISHVSAGEWFCSPIVVGYGSFFGDSAGEFILFTNNIPVWIFTIPSMIILLLMAARKKKLQLALPALLFFASYMMYMFVRRPAFLYSAVPLLPYAMTGIACMISLIAERWGARFYYGILAIILAWNMYLYPLATSKTVKVAPYRFILNNKDIMIR